MQRILRLIAHLSGACGGVLPRVGRRVESIKTAWRATSRRAGIADLRFHDLRREFGCRLLESGARLHDVREFLGHAAIGTTSRYLRASPLGLE